MNPLATRNGANAELILPYGCKLVDLMVEGEEVTEFNEYAKALPSIQLSPRSLCDIELLAFGALSPLNRFMGKADYDRVLEEIGHQFRPLAYG